MHWLLEGLSFDEIVVGSRVACAIAAVVIGVVVILRNELGNLHLTDAQEDEIAFLKTLADGYQP